MYSCALSFLLLSLLALGNANTLSGTLDVARLQNVLQEGLTSEDVPTLYHAVRGLKLLNAKIPDLCQVIKGLKYPPNNIEQIFYLTNIASMTGCVNSLNPEVLKATTQALDKKDSSILELYYAVYAQKALGKGAVMNKDEALKNLIQLLKRDDSPANYGYVFALCEHMGCADWTVSHAEGVLLAADESDGKALHFEGGLPVTSLLLTTIIRSYAAVKKAVPLSEEQRSKFAAYLLTRRAVATPRGAACLLDAALALASHDPTPISVTIKGRKYVTAEADTIDISVTDILGRPVRGLRPDDVIAQSGTRLSDDVIVLSKQPLIQKSGDPTTFTLNLSKIKAHYGMYKITLSARAKTTSVTVVVLGEVSVRGAEVGVGDVDGTTGPKLTAVTYPDRLSQKLQADNMQKLSLKWAVRDAAGRPVAVQQAFVRVGGAGREAIFVAEHDNSKAYRVELNVDAVAKHLNHVSGEYSLTIYLGDSAVSTPIAWELGAVLLNFGKDLPGAAAAGLRRGALPEIQHTFRAAEARPARALSDVFAGACAAPLALLLLLWARLGLNFSNFPLTPSALVFHLSLGASLSLYGVMWLQLTMFDTMRYLLPLAALTFLSGHRLLRRLVLDKQR